jgi:type VI secretion system protein ImpH
VAAPFGPQTPPIIAELFDQPENFSYFQALRLLYLANRDHFHSLTDMIYRGLEVISDTSLGFPASDLTGLELVRSDRHWAAQTSEFEPESFSLDDIGPESHFPEEVSDQNFPIYRLTVTFMGLCGAASPLPPFYAQEVLEDVLNEEFDCQRLFDLISFPSYRNHAEAYFHSRLPFRVIEENDGSCLNMLFSLMGLGNQAILSELDDANSFLAFMGLFITQSRSAGALLTYVSKILELPEADLEQCVLRWVEIPIDQRCSLGSSPRQYRSLGAGALLGRRAKDRSGMFRLTFSLSDWWSFNRIIPGGHARAKLEKAIDRFLTSPLVYDLKLILAPGVAVPARLGCGHRLGRSCFLSPALDQEITLYSHASGRRSP